MPTPRSQRRKRRAPESLPAPADVPRYKCTFCPRPAVRVQVVVPMKIDRPELPIRNCAQPQCITDADYAARGYQVLRVEAGEEIAT